MAAAVAATLLPSPGRPALPCACRPSDQREPEAAAADAALRQQGAEVPPLPPGRGGGRYSGAGCRSGLGSCVASSFKARHSS